MFVIYTLADVRCVRDAHAVPVALLKKIAAAVRHRHRTRGRGLSVDECALAENGFIVILQAGDGPGVYDVLGLSETLPATRPLWIGHRDDGSPVVYRVIDLRGHGRRVRLYIPADSTEDTPWTP